MAMQLVKPTRKSVADGTALWEKAKAFLDAHPAPETFAAKVHRDQVKATRRAFLGKDPAALTEMREIPEFDEVLERGVNAIQSAMLDAKERSRLKQSEIAAALGMPKGNVSRLEHSRTPSLDSFTRYLAACGYTFSIKLTRHRPSSSR